MPAWGCQSGGLGDSGQVCAGSLPARPGPQSSPVQLHHLITWLAVLSRLLSSRQSETHDLSQSHGALVCQLIKWKYLLASSPCEASVRISDVGRERADCGASEGGREQGCVEQLSAGHWLSSRTGYPVPGVGTPLPALFLHLLPLPACVSLPLGGNILSPYLWQ